MTRRPLVLAIFAIVIISPDASAGTNAGEVVGKIIGELLRVIVKAALESPGRFHSSSSSSYSSSSYSSSSSSSRRSIYGSTYVSRRELSGSDSSDDAIAEADVNTTLVQSSGVTMSGLRDEPSDGQNAKLANPEASQLDLSMQWYFTTPRTGSYTKTGFEINMLGSDESMLVYQSEDQRRDRPKEETIPVDVSFYTFRWLLGFGKRRESILLDDARTSEGITGGWNFGLSLHLLDFDTQRGRPLAEAGYVNPRIDFSANREADALITLDFGFDFRIPVYRDGRFEVGFETQAWYGNGIIEDVLLGIAEGMAEDGNDKIESAEPDKPVLIRGLDDMIAEVRGDVYVQIKRLKITFGVSTRRLKVHNLVQRMDARYWGYLIGVTCTF
ncbi:MAG: hypothetical protein NUW37_03940 [Planctomycetes bacterium]|nr:hypothetical protein [Planctomycetota bacterium]